MDQIYDEIEKLDPEYAFIRRGRSFPLEKNTGCNFREKNVILVEYFLTEDKIFISVVSHNVTNSNMVQPYYWAPFILVGDWE